jgi:hypothetical protein
MSEDRGRANRLDRARRPTVAAHDNAPANDRALAEMSERAVSTDLSPPGPRPANDNLLVPSAANDNDPLVIDDLPQPLPVMEGEGELFRQLFGDRFRQLLTEEIQ